MKKEKQKNKVKSQKEAEKMDKSENLLIHPVIKQRRQQLIEKIKNRKF
jgi:hypothetical protein